MASPHRDIDPTNLFGDQQLSNPFDAGISMVPSEDLDAYDHEVASLTFNLPPPFDWPAIGQEPSNHEKRSTEEDDDPNHHPNDGCTYISDSFFSPPDDTDSYQSYHTARSPDDPMLIEDEDTTPPPYAGEDSDLYSEISGANDTGKKFIIYGVEISFGFEDFASLNDSGTESLAKYFDAQHAAKKRATELNACPLLEGEMVSLAINAYCTRRSLELQKLTNMRQTEHYHGYKEKYGEEAYKLMDARRKWKDEKEHKYRLKWQKQRKEEQALRRLLEEEKMDRMKARQGTELDEWEEMAELYIDWLDEMQLSLIRSS